MLRTLLIPLALLAYSSIAAPASASALTAAAVSTPHAVIHASSPAHRITIITDAFGRDPALQRDWGYAALVETGGRRILFDTGNNAAMFVANARRLHLDLRHLDAVVISHRHGDHTAGLAHVLQLNPDVPVYVPDDEAFGGPTPAVFFRRGEPTLPAAMRYFDGHVPDSIAHGSAWPKAQFHAVSDAAQIAPGVRLVRNLSPGPGFPETPEISLVMDTPDGAVVVVGCSHPGIERILASAVPAGQPIAMVAGGLHLVTSEPAEVERIAVALQERFHVGRVAPGHCSGEQAFAALQQRFGAGYVYAGVGSVIDLPASGAAGAGPPLLPNRAPARTTVRRVVEVIGRPDGASFPALRARGDRSASSNVRCAATGQAHSRITGFRHFRIPALLHSCTSAFPHSRVPAFRHSAIQARS